MIGLKITKYDIAGLQITIDFGLQSATEILKIRLKSAMGLPSATSLDYKLQWDYKAWWITRWYSTTSISKNVYIEKLNDIVNKYINAYHITIKMKPVDVKSKHILTLVKKLMKKILNLKLMIL